jgi:hypothetical protein
MAGITGMASSSCAESRMGKKHNRKMALTNFIILPKILPNPAKRSKGAFYC